MTMLFPAREFGRKNAGERADDHLELKSIMDALTARDAQIKAFAEKANAEIANTGKMAAETKAALDKIVGEAAGLQARMLDVEQKLARRAGGSGSAYKSLGQQFTDSDQFKALVAQGRGIARLNVKTVQTITSAPSGYDDSPQVTGGAGAAIVADRRPGVLMPAERVMSIRNLLMPGRTSSSSVEYVREVGFQNSAAPVAEGGTRPQSDLTFDLVTANVRTIAHYFTASKQVIQDIPLLQSYIQTRSVSGLRYAEEDQLLNGDGTGQELDGLIYNATAFDTGLSEVGDTAIDMIRRAALQVRLAELRPSFIVLHPEAWAGIELTKDGDSGRYLFVNIQAGAAMVLWRLAVIETTAIGDSDKFLVGAGEAAQIFDREDAAVELSTEHGDNWTKGLVSIGAEERLTLAVYRPESFIYGTLPS